MQECVNKRIKTWRDAQRPKREDHGAWLNFGSTYNIYKPTLKNKSARACQQGIKTWRDAQRTKREDHGAWLNLGSLQHLQTISQEKKCKRVSTKD